MQHELQQLLNPDGFRPFRIHLPDGITYPITHPRIVELKADVLLVFDTATHDSLKLIINLLTVSAIEIEDPID